MAWEDINNSTGESWKKKVHPDDSELVRRCGEGLKQLILESNGKFIGTYYEILTKAGYDETYYGNLFCSMRKIKHLYNIESRRLGPKGTAYLIKESTPKHIAYTQDSSTLYQIKVLVNAIDIDKSNNEELKAAFRILKVLCNNETK